MPDRFCNVTGEIYRGGQPSARDLQMLSDVYGIKTVVSLDGNIGADISPAVQDLGMEHIIIPIGGRGSISLINYLRENVGSLLESSQPVYVHCRHGSDRTGMAVALFRIQKQGWNPSSALSEAKKYNFGDKLDADTETLYTDTILGDDSSSAMDSDITESMRDQFDMGRVAPAYLPQQSFSAPDDYKYDAPDESIMEPPPAFKDPYGFVSSRPPSDRGEKPKKDLRKMLLQILNESVDEAPEGVPQVGGRDGGSVPMGVGPTETGGMLNL